MFKILLLVIMLFSVPAHVRGEDLSIDMSREAKERGMAVFMQHCVACHGVKYYRAPGSSTGIAPLMDPRAAEASFGVAPADLSLMTSSRGKGVEGAEYIYSLLTTYYTENGRTMNRAFAEQTHTDGMIAMPPPIPMDDPELTQKANDVSAFLFEVSNPDLEERRSLGPWVLIYMAILTAVLYALNRYTWREQKKKMKG
ncbi:MAG TPA: hypothetical protein DDW94_07245 [Deltaproteobacteria bacterium]|nr:MAG: hypothetical protein A2Z79_01775 [Deltaproteobacteria bacterium GWA2_55_82]OGQ62562.1 MAG: hypothetical protein A3I81_08590 [Deltaproteobacteria bacterium RIFCSPLOWO2_02_FULL_55_12]OIJ74150.1 MAG: hypothetical protein A2V21_307675 [Deltaproteobacteria bacterium GWC2_55_46]HBG46770.1 hypothetical protein [Deltaproteobacteria bacterium]HCY11221.1 hypothetical protein [Deltaproteobacteria bacterium]